MIVTITTTYRPSDNTYGVGLNIGRGTHVPLISGLHSLEEAVEALKAEMSASIKMEIDPIMLRNKETARLLDREARIVEKAKAWLDLHYPTRGDGEWSLEFVAEIAKGQHVGHSNRPNAMIALAMAEREVIPQH